MKITKLENVPTQAMAFTDVKGITKQVPVGVADGAPNFSMRVFTVDPGGYTPYHQHAWEHENYVLRGKGVLVDAAGLEHPLEAGDFALVLPGEMHQFRNNSATEQLQFICLVPKEYE